MIADIKMDNNGGIMLSSKLCHRGIKLYILHIMQADHFRIKRLYIIILDNIEVIKFIFIFIIFW